jgi:hypothetical protein
VPNANRVTPHRLKPKTGKACRKLPHRPASANLSHLKIIAVIIKMQTHASFSKIKKFSKMARQNTEFKFIGAQKMIDRMGDVNSQKPMIEAGVPLPLVWSYLRTKRRKVCVIFCYPVRLRHTVGRKGMRAAWKEEIYLKRGQFVRNLPLGMTKLEKLNRSSRHRNSSYW